MEPLGNNDDRSGNLEPSAATDHNIAMAAGSEPAGPPEPDETVGYGHPPIATRFKPGQSGNPRGRPKGARSLNTIVRDVLTEKIATRIGERRRKIPVWEAVIRTSANQALKGDLKAAATLIGLARNTGALAPDLDPAAWQKTAELAAEDRFLLSLFLQAGADTRSGQTGSVDDDTP